MADKYCDHGLYGEDCSFTGHIHNSSSTTYSGSAGTVLVVTAVSTGRLNLGSRVVTGAADHTVITALGTGTGGTGTYTVQSQAVPSTAMTAVDSMPLAIPVWNTAQEGDGTATGAATPATAKIVFTATPVGAISVCGVTVTPTWGSGADAAANGLATAINAASGTVTTTGARASTQLRDFVYARGPAAGAAAGTCDVMTRAGSATWNAQVAIAHTLTNVNAGASSLSFASGAGGAWGWLLNPVTGMWPSSLSIANYGVWGSTGPPFAGSIQGGDVIHLRANNNKVLFGANTALTPTLFSMGSAGSMVDFVVGDPAVWVGDSVNSLLSLSHQSPVNNVVTTFTATSSSFFNIDGGVASDGSPRLVYELTNPSATGTLVLRLGARVGTIKNFRASAPGANVASLQAANSVSGNGDNPQFVDGVVSQSNNAAFLSTSAGQDQQVQFRNITLDATGSTAANSGILQLNSGSTGRMVLDSIRCVGFVTQSSLHRGVPSQNVQIEVVDCDLGNVVSGIKVSTAYTIGTKNPYLRSTAVYNRHTRRDFVLDYQKGYVEYLSQRSFPTLNAVLFDGSSWSWRFCPSTFSSSVYRHAPFESPRITKENTLGAGYRTLTLQMAISAALTWTTANVGMRVHYTDTSDVIRTEELLPLVGAPLTTSSVTWSSQSTGSDGGVAGQVKFDDGGGNLFFNKRSISLTTAYQVKAGSEVSVMLLVATSVALADQFSFLDPDVGMT